MLACEARKWSTLPSAHPKVQRVVSMVRWEGAGAKSLVTHQFETFSVGLGFTSPNKQLAPLMQAWQDDFLETLYSMLGCFIYLKC